MASIWEAELPWYGKLLAFLMSSIPELQMGRGYHRTPSAGSRSPFANTNELQDIMSRAQREETTTDPRFNDWFMQNLPGWIKAQDPTYAQRLMPHMGGQLGTAMKAGPGEYGVGDIQNLFGALQDPYVAKGIPRRHEPLRLMSPYATEKRGFEMGKLGAEEEKRTRTTEGFEAFGKAYPDLNIPLLEAAKGIGGKEAVEKLAPGMFLPPKPEKPKRASVSWLNAPKKKEAEIQKWVTAWERYVFGDNYEYESLNPAEKRIHFNKWAKQIPQSTSAQRVAFYEVRKRVGMDPTASAGVSGIPGVPPAEKPKPQDPKDIYNACRDAGGNHEDCLAKAGVSLP